MAQHNGHIPLPLAAGALALAALLAANHAEAEEGSWDGAYLGASLGVATSDGDDSLRSLHGGILRDRGGMTLGAELEVIETDIGTRAGPIERMVRAKARIGTVRNDVHYYGVAGLVEAEGRFGDDTGYVLGVGAETQLGSHVSVGAELLHHGFGNFAGSGDLGVNTLTARMTYHF